MKRRLIPVLIIYLLSFVCANLLVKSVGAYGLWFSSFFLIPFDFVARCILHETWKGKKLIFNLFLLTLGSGIVTYIINRDALNIAFASISGFTVAQIAASIFYQSNKNKSWFFKVNIADLFAIITDSLTFQYIAFAVINPSITIGQVIVKFTGGLLWYYILFKKIKIQNKLL
jgi:queuosine precursor transporter